MRSKSHWDGAAELAEEIESRREEAIVESEAQCESTCWDKLGDGLRGCHTRCRLADGHDGQHTDGAMSWCDPDRCRCGREP